MNARNERDVSSFANFQIQCQCGHTHTVPIRYIYTGTGILSKLSDILRDFGGKKVFLIGDANTMPLAEEKVTAYLQEAGCQVVRHVFAYHGTTHQVLDEKLIGNMLIHLPQDTDLIVTIGSGTMNDLSRVISTRCHIPYVIIGTAPSMDGYASATSAVLVDGDKISVPLQSPYGILCDTELMRTAPEMMLAAGFCDVLGKYIAIRDWQLSERETGEYFCPYIAGLVTSAVSECIKEADRLFDGGEKVLLAIANALVLSGVTISMYGISRPAAGGEHRIAHCWEVAAVNSGNNRFLHGNYVGLGTLVMAKLYELAEKEENLPPYEDMPSFEQIQAYLNKMRGYSSFETLQITKEMLGESLRHAAKSKARYTLLTYLEGKGKLEKYIQLLEKEFFG